MDMIAVGKIVGAHGLKGMVKAIFFSGDAFDPGASVLLEGPSGETKSFGVDEWRPNKKELLLSLEGVDSREAAEALRDHQIMSRRSDLPQTDPGVYYWVDLIGMDVFEKDGRRLGRLDSIMETGSADVYVIKGGVIKGGVTKGDPADQPKTEILIPALESIILNVDTEAKTMMVSLPQGLEPEDSKQG